MNKYNIGFICAYFRIVNRPFGCILRRNLHIKSLVRLYFGTIYICMAILLHFLQSALFYYYYAKFPIYYLYYIKISLLFKTRRNFN